MKKGLLLFAAAVMITARANAADDICADIKDEKQCAFVKAWVTAPQQFAAKANTGIGSMVSPGQSTTKDFLSMLAAALLVPMTGDGTRQTALETNLPLLEGQRLKLQAVLAKPELSADLKQRLGNNSTALTDMQRSLSNVDDVSVSASLDAATRRLGRSIDPHRAAYGAMLATTVPQTAETQVKEDAAKKFARQFAFLLNHQPQIFGTVIYRERENVAGPNERSARITYEKGFLNLNKFYAQHGCGKVDDTANAARCARELSDFVGDRTVDDKDDRISMAVEYRMSDSLNVALPQYKVDFHATNAHSLVYSLAYGRSSMFMKNDRVDVSVNYEDTTVSAATDVAPPAAAARITSLAQAAATAAPKTVRDRFVASATYSYKINDMMSMPLTLTYANHASYLGDVGRKLNAHFGISMKMNP